MLATWAGQASSGGTVTRTISGLSAGQQVCVTVTAWSDKTTTLSESAPTQQVCGTTLVPPPPPPPPPVTDFWLTGMITVARGGSFSCGSARFFIVNSQGSTILDQLATGEVSGFDCVYRVDKIVKAGTYAVTVDGWGCTKVNVQSNTTAVVRPGVNNGCVF